MIHYGRVNTYAFKYKRHNLTFAPLPPPEPPKIKQGKGSEKSVYMSETRVEKAISKSKLLFTLFLVKANTSEQVRPLHPLAQSLPIEFGDVFPNDVPLRVPPLSEIEHQIDLLSDGS